MRCLEAAFVMLLGWVFSFRKYRPSFRKKKKKNILQIVDHLFVSSCFVSKITLSPHYVRIRKKEKSKIQMMTWKQLKQGCMQTLDNNFEMLKKAERRSTSKHPTTSCSLFQKLICFIAALHKRNSSAFFLSFAAITQLISSVPQITFLSSTLNFWKVSLIFTNTTLSSFLPMRATSYLASFSRHNFGTRFFLIAWEHWELRKWPISSKFVEYRVQFKMLEVWPSIAEGSQPHCHEWQLFSPAQHFIFSNDESDFLLSLVLET